MAEQWYSHWEKDSGLTDETGDLVMIVEKESDNNLAPTAYQQFFRQIKVFMERSQQRRPSEMISTPHDTTDTENDYLYKDFATILQANFEDLETVYKKEYSERKNLETELSDTKMKNLELQRSLDAAQKEIQQLQQSQQQQQTQTKELLGRMNEHEKIHAQLMGDLTKERRQHLDLKVLLQRFTEQAKFKDTQLLNGAKQRQIFETEMMKIQKALSMQRSETIQRTTDMTQLIQLTLALSTLPNARPTFIRHLNESISLSALQTMLVTGTNHQQIPSVQQSLIQVRQAIHQRHHQQQHQHQHPQHHQYHQHQSPTTSSSSSSSPSMLPQSNTNGVIRSPDQFPFN